ncbi:MAG: PAS domain-containing protein, partial [Pirellulales bacterium]|nr:PAS domain-containing protein [Pirellulales bacterium]
MSQVTHTEDWKRAERASQLTQCWVNVAAEAMFTFSPTGQLLSVNQTACQRLEYSQDELLSMRVADIAPHCSADFWREHIEELRRKRKMTF